MTATDNEFFGNGTASFNLEGNLVCSCQRRGESWRDRRG